MGIKTKYVNRSWNKGETREILEQVDSGRKRVEQKVRTAVCPSYQW